MESTLKDENTILIKTPGLVQEVDIRPFVMQNKIGVPMHPYSEQGPFGIILRLALESCPELFNQEIESDKKVFMICRIMEFYNRCIQHWVDELEKMNTIN